MKNLNESRSNDRDAQALLGVAASLDKVRESPYGTIAGAAAKSTRASIPPL